MDKQMDALMIAFMDTLMDAFMNAFMNALMKYTITVKNCIQVTECLCILFKIDCFKKILCKDLASKKAHIRKSIRQKEHTSDGLNVNDPVPER